AAESFIVRYQFVDFSVGVLFALACLSLAVHGLSLAGWSSNTKYGMFGAVRASAQLISYEAAMFRVVLVMIMIYGTLDLREMVLAQVATAKGLLSIFDWGLFRQPLAFLIFVVCAFAESNRLPF